MTIQGAFLSQPLWPLTDWIDFNWKRTGNPNYIVVHHRQDPRKFFSAYWSPFLLAIQTAEHLLTWRWSWRRCVTWAIGAILTGQQQSQLPVNSLTCSPETEVVLPIVLLISSPQTTTFLVPRFISFDHWPLDQAIERECRQGEGAEVPANLEQLKKERIVGRTEGSHRISK